jgi:hypothetical protein
VNAIPGLEEIRVAGHLTLSLAMISRYDLGGRQLLMSMEEYAEVTRNKDDGQQVVPNRTEEIRKNKKLKILRCRGAESARLGFSSTFSGF